MYGDFGSIQPEILKNPMGLDMQRVEGHSFLGEVGKGSRVLLWVAHNGVVKGHSGCIVEKGVRKARKRGGRCLVDSEIMPINSWLSYCC